MRRLLPFLVLTVAAILGGCVAYPAYPTYAYGGAYEGGPYYGGTYYGGPYVSGGVATYGGGWGRGWHRGWYHHDGWYR
jgi:hypothetical protein